MPVRAVKAGSTIEVSRVASKGAAWLHPAFAQADGGRRKVFLIRALQFFKFGFTPLQLVYLESCYYNFIYPSSMSFSTPLAYMDPLSGTYAYRKAYGR